MNKRNISIITSTFIAAFVVSVLVYILVTQNLELYSIAREKMPEDITLYSKIHKDKIKELEKLKNVAYIGLKAEDVNLKFKENIFTLKTYDSNYFHMQKNFKKKGEFPKKNKEILISDFTSNQLNTNIGDTLVFEKGNRKLKGDDLEPASSYNTNESFETLEKIEYKITGIYNSTSESEIQKIYSNIGNDKYFYPAIKLKNLFKIFDTKLDIEGIIGEKNYTILNQPVIRFFSIDENGFNIFKFFASIVLIPLILISIFAYMIKNILNIWGIYKIKEFSMYKSIGATNFQIYKLLFREIFKISLLPIILGQICGLNLVMMVFNRLFSLQEEILLKNLGRFSFNWQSIIIINFILFLIIVVAITFPSRIISHIDILDGLKENIQTKNMKRKRHENLFKELKLNNRKFLKPAFVIMILGLFLIIFLLGINSLNNYNEAKNKINRDFNMLVRYSTEDNSYPKVFNRIKEEFNPKKSIISISKSYYVDTSNFTYSNEFNTIGYSKGFDGIFYYSDENLVDGSLIGIDDERFSKISDNKSDLVLINLVQKNPKSFYSEAQFIPYLSEDTKSLKIKELEDFKGHELKINKIYNNFFEDQDLLSLYNINLVTSLENFKNIIDNSKNEFLERKMEFPRLYYKLEMKFDEENLEVYKNKIKNILEDSVSSREKFSVTDIVTIKKGQELNNQSMYFLGMVSIIAIFLLNIANSYAATNLTFFNRKNEIGSLLSNGMEVTNLENVLMHEMRNSIIKSVFASILIAILSLGLLIKTIPYVSITKYLSMYPFAFTIFLILLVCSTNYIIYYFAMKKIVGKDIIGLLKL